MSSPITVFDPRGRSPGPMQFETFKEVKEMCARVSNFSPLNIPAEFWPKESREILKDFEPFVMRSDGTVFDGLHSYLGLDKEPPPRLILCAESDKGLVDGMLILRGKEVEYLGTSRLSHVPSLVSALVKEALNVSQCAIVLIGKPERMERLKQILAGGRLTPISKDKAELLVENNQFLSLSALDDDGRSSVSSLVSASSGGSMTPFVDEKPQTS